MDIEKEFKEKMCKNCTGCNVDSIYKCQHFSKYILSQLQSALEQNEQNMKNILEYFKKELPEGCRQEGCVTEDCPLDHCVKISWTLEKHYGKSIEELLKESK